MCLSRWGGEALGDIARYSIAEEEVESLVLILLTGAGGEVREQQPTDGLQDHGVG